VTFSVVVPVVVVVVPGVLVVLVPVVVPVVPVVVPVVVLVLVVVPAAPAQLSTVTVYCLSGPSPSISKWYVPGVLCTV
jgi:hypothetical protein